MPNLLQKIIRPSKQKERSQFCEIHTLDRRIEEIELDVTRNCMFDDKKIYAFLVDGDNQYSNEDGTWTQILNDQSLYPVDSIVKREEEDTKLFLLQIYRESKAMAKAEQFNSATKKKTSLFLWAVSIFCGTMIIIAGIYWLKG